MSTNACQARASLSTAERVRRYIDERPLVRAALAQDLINLSELTRQIVAETDLSGKHAILAACRRYADDLDPEPYGERIRQALADARLDVRTGVESLTIDATRRDEASLEPVLCEAGRSTASLHLIDEGDRIEVITEPSPAARIRQALPKRHLLATRENLVEARIRLSEPAQTVHGLASFIASSLAQRGVDTLHQITGTRSITLVFEQDQLTPVISVLDPLIGA